MMIIGMNAFAQTHSIKVTVKDLPKNLVYLLDYEGDQNNLLDSASADVGGNFKFTMKDGYHPGLYKIILGKEESSKGYGSQEIFVNIIYNKEDIAFSTDYGDAQDSVRIISSAENKIYYDYLFKDNKDNTQLEVLSQLPEYFPASDPFYPELKKRYFDLQEQHQKFISDIIKKNPGMFVTHIIKSERFPSLDFTLTHDEKIQFAKKHFMDNIDFSDTLLLNTNIFTSKSFSFIKFFASQGYTKPQQEQEYIKAVDTLMTRSKVNEKVNTQIKKYLITGFEMLEMESVLTHIASYYTSESSCEDDRQTKNLRKRVDGYKKLAIGNKAPEITFTAENNVPYKLSETKSPYTLVIFWASWCPHCMATLPEIKKLYDLQKNNKLAVVGISIDTVKAEFDKAILNGDYKWINYTDLKGWDGDIASAYYLYATPSMFLLDADKKIVAKPITLSDLMQELQKAGIVD